MFTYIKLICVLLALCCLQAKGLIFSGESVERTSCRKWADDGESCVTGDTRKTNFVSCLTSPEESNRCLDVCCLDLEPKQCFYRDACTENPIQHAVGTTFTDQCQNSFEVAPNCSLDFVLRNDEICGIAGRNSLFIVDASGTLRLFDEDSAAKSKSCQTVELSNKKIITIGDALINVVDFSSVTELILDGNLIEFVSKSFMNLFPSLTSMQLMGNRISGIEKGAFDQLSNLKNLELYGNAIANLPSDLFVRLTNLENLDLSYNQIRSLDETKLDTLSLHTLKLHNNKLLGISSPAFASLEILDLSENSIECCRISPIENTTITTTIRGTCLDENGASLNIANFLGSSTLRDACPETVVIEEPQRTDDEPSNSSGGLSTNIIIVIASVAACIGLIIIGLGIFCIRKKRKKNQEKAEKSLGGLTPRQFVMANAADNTIVLSTDQEYENSKRMAQSSLQSSLQASDSLPQYNQISRGHSSHVYDHHKSRNNDNNKHLDQLSTFDESDDFFTGGNYWNPETSGSAAEFTFADSSGHQMAAANSTSKEAVDENDLSHVFLKDKVSTETAVVVEEENDYTELNSDTIDYFEV